MMVFLRVALLAILLGTDVFPVVLGGAESHVDWMVDARCNPEVRTTAPARITLGITVVSSASQSQVNGTLIIGGASTSQAGIPSVPKAGWVSFVFPGPVFEAQYFCAEAQTFRDLHLSYAPRPSLKLAVSDNGEVTRSELAAYGSPAGTIVQVRADGSDPTLFRAGGGTPAPYWLQYSLFLGGVGNIETTLYSRF